MATVGRAMPISSLYHPAAAIVIATAAEEGVVMEEAEEAGVAASKIGDASDRTTEVAMVATMSREAGRGTDPTVQKHAYLVRHPITLVIIALFVAVVW